MRDRIVEATQTLLTNYPDFWIWAALSDCGIEEGKRNSNLGTWADVYKGNGVPKDICADLRAGINGLLFKIIRQQNPGCKIKPSPNRGRDIVIRSPDLTTAIEVKHVYDQTGTPYFDVVAEDREKLLKFRREEGRSTELFLVVIFVQMPNANYPAGEWVGSGFSKARRSLVKVKARTIDKQYRLVADRLGHAAWPSDSPRVVPIAREGGGVDAMRGYFDCGFRSSDPDWRFDPNSYFKEAAVGAAIWSF